MALSTSLLRSWAAAGLDECWRPLWLYGGDQTNRTIKGWGVSPCKSVLNSSGYCVISASSDAVHWRPSFAWLRPCRSWTSSVTRSSDALECLVALQVNNTSDCSTLRGNKAMWGGVDRGHEDRFIPALPRRTQALVWTQVTELETGMVVDAVAEQARWSILASSYGKGINKDLLLYIGGAQIRKGAWFLSETPYTLRSYILAPGYTQSSQCSFFYIMRQSLN
jgi:hypothetical protein